MRKSSPLALRRKRLTTLSGRPSSSRSEGTWRLLRPVRQGRVLPSVHALLPRFLSTSPAPKIMLSVVPDLYPSGTYKTDSTDSKQQPPGRQEPLPFQPKVSQRIPTAPSFQTPG
eukprot:108338-Pleurochrysis_carterae.AAC.1